MRAGHEKWVSVISRKFFLIEMFFLFKLLLVNDKVEIIGFIYIIVVIEFAMTMGIRMKIVFSLVSREDRIVFNLGMNPIIGGIPMIDNMAIRVVFECEF